MSLRDLWNKNKAGIVLATGLAASGVVLLNDAEEIIDKASQLTSSAVMYGVGYFYISSFCSQNNEQDIRGNKDISAKDASGLVAMCRAWDKYSIAQDILGGPGFTELLMQEKPLADLPGKQWKQNPRIENPELIHRFPQYYPY